VSKKLPRLWRKKRGGKLYGAWLATIDGDDVSLQTKDAELARQRLPAALKGARNFQSDAAAAAAASEPGVEELGGAEAARVGEFPAVPVAPPSSPAPVVPDQVIRPPLQLAAMPESEAQAEAEATAAAAQEVAGDGGFGGADPPLPPPPEISNKELALLGVEAQLWVAQQYARSKVWKGYTAPQLPPEAKAPLAEQWEKIIAYSNLGAMLPPWVTGLVIPGVTIVVATASLGQVFAAHAAEQKRAAGVQDEQKPADPPPAQAAA
jgi:hypothetical protein